MKIAIIGGGASGMMAGILLGQMGHSVFLFEKNAFLGKKLLITGKGRCNVTNDTTGEEFLSNVVRGKKFMLSAERGFNSADTKAFFEGLGVGLKTERGKRVFPISDRAVDVRDAMERALKQAGAHIIFNAAVEKICVTSGNENVTSGDDKMAGSAGNAVSGDDKMAGSAEISVSGEKNIVGSSGRDVDKTGKNNTKESGKHSVTESGKGVVTGVVVNGKREDFDAVIVATGGCSYPLTGSTGDGIKFAKNVGHKITPLAPALNGIKIGGGECKKLEGLSLKNVRVSATFEGKTVYTSDIGEMLFTSVGVSGPLVFTMSSFINRAAVDTISINFKPGLTREQLISKIDREVTAMGAKQVRALLRSMLPERLVDVFLARLMLSETTKCSQLSRETRGDLVNLLSAFPLKFVSVEPIETSVVTSGGIDTTEISPKDCQSKLVRGLFFIGEVLDVDALTGGFNLQIAFSTAAACARSKFFKGE